MKHQNKDELGQFFALYNQFDYDPQEASRVAYNRLVAFFGWKKQSKQERKARERFQIAIVGRFEQLYGADENKLDILQTLCEKIGISPIPGTITSCKKAIKTVHVNIYDFIDSEQTGEPVRTFDSLNQFRAYTKKNGKVFPKEDAKDNALLRFLLRPVFSGRRGV
ncbi:hypothetical protein ACQKWADRAFT_271065 [Trichoderma austrokoningii]